MYIPVFVVAQRVEKIPWHWLTVFIDTGINAGLGAQAQAQGLYEFNQLNKTEKNRAAQLEASAWWEPKYIYSMFPDSPQLHLFTIISVLIPNTNLFSLPQPLLRLTPQVLNYKNNTQTQKC